MNGILYLGKLHQPVLEYAEHRHPHWELVYYTEGSGSLWVGERERRFEAGALFFLPPEIPHREQGAEPFCNIHMGLLEPGLCPAWGPVCDRADRPVRQLLELLYREFHRADAPGLTGALLTALEEYLASLLSQTQDSYWVAQLKRLLLEHLSDSAVSVSELLSSLPLQPDTLRRRFRAETGLSPQSYLTSKRLEHARRLLQNQTGLPVCQIALLCGYDDPYYFSRAFKKAVGVSPSVFTRNAGQ